MPEQVLDAALEGLARGAFGPLIGLYEDHQFEAKGPVAYDFATPNSRYELAKDVTSFANSNGGVIVVGLDHSRNPNSALDVVRGLSLIPSAAFNPRQYLGVIREHTYPTIHGIDVRWIEHDGGGGAGLGVIRIPPQSADAKPFTILRVVEDGTHLKQFVLGYALRSGPDSVPMTAHQIQQNLKRGMDTVGQRLAAIEVLLEFLVERDAAPHPAAEPPPIANRIRRILET